MTMGEAGDADAQRGSDVLAELRQRYGGLTQSQKRIAETIVEDPEFVAFATVDKLAGRLGVAPSTVVRFAYRIGLGGYQELQELVRRSVRAQIRAYSGMDAADEGVLGSHLQESGHAVSLLHDLDNLRQTIADLEPDVLNEAIRLLAESERVFVVGGVASGALAAYTGLALERIRGMTFLIGNDISRHVPTLLDLTAQDTLLIYAFAPYSSNSVRVIDLAKSTGAQLLGITDTPISPVGQRVDVVITARVSGMGPQNSLVAPLAVTNALLNGVAAQVPASIDRYAHIMQAMDEFDLFVLSGADLSSQR